MGAVAWTRIGLLLLLLLLDVVFVQSKLVKSNSTVDCGVHWIHHWRGLRLIKGIQVTHVRRRLV